MALTVQFANPALVFPGDGSIRAKFADGSEMEFADADTMRSTILASLPSIDDLRALAIASRLAKDPLMDSPGDWNGKKVTLDMEQVLPSNVFQVQ